MDSCCIEFSRRALVALAVVVSTEYRPCWNMLHFARNVVSVIDGRSRPPSVVGACSIVVGNPGWWHSVCL